MTPEDLLRVEPEVLAKLILHKRERISQSLPKIIESLGEEKHTAENLARKSRAEKGMKAKENAKPNNKVILLIFIYFPFKVIYKRLYIRHFCHITCQYKQNF